jgi:hypothetical protein
MSLRAQRSNLDPAETPPPEIAAPPGGRLAMTMQNERNPR